MYYIYVLNIFSPKSLRYKFSTFNLLKISGNFQSLLYIAAKWAILSENVCLYFKILIIVLVCITEKTIFSLEC